MNDRTTSAPHDGPGRSGEDRDADVVVVGAGPAGSSAAYHLARAGLDVLLLEKDVFPREKVCGDGLTPRGVRAVLDMGIDISPANGWVHVRGMRIVGAGHSILLPWSDLCDRDFPAVGLVRPRADFDELLARTAERAGARLLQAVRVTGPVVDERTGRVTGVTAVTTEGGRRGPERTYRAPVVIAADGNSARFALSLGLDRDEARPMGVAYRTYFTSPRHDDPWMEGHLELWDRTGPQPRQLPGYGWVFPVGDGTCNVGLGILNSSAAFRSTDYRELLRAWTSGLPAEWGFTPDNQVGGVRGAALPMAFNRKPHYTRGVLLVGDAGGMVNPFNGEGIAYAMESGRFAAEAAAEALAHPRGLARERALHRYPEAVTAAWGGYYSLGRVFVRAIGHPEVMRLCTRYGLPRRTLMRFTGKLLTNLTDVGGRDLMDRLINTLAKAAPAA